MPSCAPRAGHRHHRAKGPPYTHPPSAFFNQRWLKLQSSRNCVVTQVKTNKTAWSERPTSSSPFSRADLLPLCKLYSSLIDYGFETSEAKSSSNAHHRPLFRLPSFRFPHQTMLVHDHDGLQVLRASCVRCCVAEPASACFMATSVCSPKDPLWTMGGNKDRQCGKQLQRFKTVDLRLQAGRMVFRGGKFK